MNLRLNVRILVAVGVLLVVGRADAQTTLRFKFTKGQTVAYDLVQDLNMKAGEKGADKSGDADLKQMIDVTQTAVDVLADGSAKILIKMPRVRLSLKGPAEVAVDSDVLTVPAGDELAKTVAKIAFALSKINFTATQKPTGEMTDPQFPAAELKEIGEFPGMSEQSIRTLLTQTSIVLPSDPVKAGQSWPHKTVTKLPAGKMTVDVKYTYQGPETVAGKTLQKITYTTTTSIDNEVGAPVSVKITKQKGDGVVLFDNEAGRIYELRADISMDMTLGFINQTIEQSMNQRITMKAK